MNLFFRQATERIVADGALAKIVAQTSLVLTRCYRALVLNSQADDFTL